MSDPDYHPSNPAGLNDCMRPGCGDRVAGFVTVTGGFSGGNYTLRLCERHLAEVR